MAITRFEASAIDAALRRPHADSMVGTMRRTALGRVNSSADRDVSHAMLGEMYGSAELDVAVKRLMEELGGKDERKA